jgi:hypothetical protein
MTWSREGVSSDNSPELVTYQRLPEPAWDSAETTMNKLKAPTEQRCAGSVWHVIRRGESDILYEWKAANCPDNRDAVEIARII